MKKTKTREDDELVVICTFCGLLLKGADVWSENAENSRAVSKSHGICPACLLENYPNEYLAIQKHWRIRIKNEFSNGLTDLSQKLVKRKC